MPISHEWDDEAHTAYRIELAGSDWVWQELSDAVREIYRNLGTVEHRVNLIMWFKDALPPGNVLAHMRVIGVAQPPNIRHTVFINNSGQFLETLITSFDRANKWTGPRFVQTLAEARTYLAEKNREDQENPPD